MEGGNAFDITGREEDDVVRRAGDATGSRQAGLTLTGFLGNSPRDGYRRIYLDRALERYVEFAVDDVVGGREVPADESPFVGERATSVTLTPDARVDVARTVAADAFDLNPRLGNPLTSSPDGFLFLGDSTGPCASQRYRCTRLYCQDLDQPESEVAWPFFRRP
jgi:hypothetical protein